MIKYWLTNKEGKGEITIFAHLAQYIQFSDSFEPVHPPLPPSSTRLISPPILRSHHVV